MDPLSQVLSLLKPSGVFWHLVEAQGDWKIGFNPENVVVFGQMLSGTATVRRADGIEFVVDAGDFLLMVDPPSWSMAIGTGREAIEFKTLLSRSGPLAVDESKFAGAKFIAGNFSFAVASSELFRFIVRSVALIKSGEMENQRLIALLSALGDEVMDERPARNFIVERLLEVILAEALRYRGLVMEVTSPGLIAGLQDPKVGSALKLVHKDAKKSWTVSQLARDVGLSRSAFAMRFTEIVGVPPIDYISRWRMLLAKNALADSSLSMAEIAEMVGFQSVSAFSTSFKRETGLPPSAYRKASVR